MVTAESGQQGIELAREIRPSLITLDVLMPGLDGWSVLQELKRDPDSQDIPVVMLTIVDEENQAYALGAAAYLTKPIDRDRLRRRSPPAAPIKRAAGADRRGRCPYPRMARPHAA